MKKVKKLTILVLLILLTEVNAQSDSVSNFFTLLAFGDINLGRSVGKIILNGDLDYPFEKIRSSLPDFDAFFANLESPLANRNGETEHPKSNVIFCGPPEGALALKRGGVTVVSAANNHSNDYGLDAVKETIHYLKEQGIGFIGTSEDSVNIFHPYIIQKNSIKVGFVAYTQFLNFKKGIAGYISQYDASRIQKEIALARNECDIVIASYHCGKEYTDNPEESTLRELCSFIDAGADAVIGHHSHYPQGILQYKGKLIFCSLGNFIFSQKRYWSQRGMGIVIKFEKNQGKISISNVEIIPVEASLQPERLRSEKEVNEFVHRIGKLSNIKVFRNGEKIVVQNDEN